MLVRYYGTVLGLAPCILVPEGILFEEVHEVGGKPGETEAVCSPNPHKSIVDQLEASIDGRGGRGTIAW